MKRFLTLALLAALTVPASARPFTARDLVMLDRVSTPRLSPDGTLVLYSVRTTDFAANRGRTTLWLAPTNGSRPAQRFAATFKDAAQARFSPDGKFIYLLSSAAGSPQVWRTDTSGHHARQITNVPVDVQGFRVAPDGKHIVFTAAVFPDCATLACTHDRLTQRTKRKSSGILYDRIFIRHWDTWADGTRNHLFAMAIDERGAPISLMHAFDGDSPSKPFGGDEDYAISPDSKTVVFSARLGHGEPWSTNFDLWQVPMDGASGPRNLTQANPAWDAAPVFSPDGTRLAYLAQKRPGFESDRFAIMMRELKSGATRELAPKWDHSAGGLTWSHDGRALFVTADDNGNHRLFAIDPASGAVKALTQDGSIEGFDVAAGKIVYDRSTLRSPAQLFLVTQNGGAPRQLTHANESRLAGVALSTFKRFTFAGWNNETVSGTVVLPYGYRADKKFPVAFLIHGGPQGAWNNGWSYRWNPQTYAGQGYAVVDIDFHGSTGYGQAFTDSISQHWGDRPLEDLQKGWAAALDHFAFLNGDRACALGASYGGYMIDWIAGNWKTPWKCLVSHDGVFDNRMMGYSTEELWFSEWENGGTPWDHPDNYERFNPVDHVADWSVPMLVIHSSNDYRIPLEQGIAAFTALQRKGIASKLLTFPDENHWVLKPQNSLEWHDTVNAWLARWLK